MSKPKSAYLGYTEQEIRMLEENYFTFQLGGDFVLEGDSYFFNRTEANRIYRNTVKDLRGITIDGSGKDRNYAIDLIGSLRIVPLRFH